MLDVVKNLVVRYWPQIDRVLWTAVQAGLGAAIDVGSTGEVSWRTAAYAAGLAFVKVVIAPFVGKKGELSIP